MAVARRKDFWLGRLSHRPCRARLDDELKNAVQILGWVLRWADRIICKGRVTQGWAVGLLAALVSVTVCLPMFHYLSRWHHQCRERDVQSGEEGEELLGASVLCELGGLRADVSLPN